MRVMRSSIIAGPTWRMSDGLLRQGKVVDEYSKQGVWLARLVQLDPPRRIETGD